MVRATREVLTSEEAPHTASSIQSSLTASPAEVRAWLLQEGVSVLPPGADAAAFTTWVNSNVAMDGQGFAELTKDKLRECLADAPTANASMVYHAIMAGSRRWKRGE